MEQTVDISTFSPKQFKALQRQFAEEQKHRGPSGQKKLPINTPGLHPIILSIESLALEKSSNVVEVLDAVLRAKKEPFYIASSDRKRAGNESAEEVSITR